MKRSFDKVYEEYRLAPEVTRRRMYYETMEQILQKVPKTIIEAPGVTPYLPLPGSSGKRRSSNSSNVATATAGRRPVTDFIPTARF